ncbi:SirB2 family protein [Simiduia litorea]|uniref:SirB2 family protein n=1 Tax=Simiduia litorea TaxID=1435348 RepID=UPI0036F38306
MLVLKHLHATFALLSLIGFVLRGIWLLRSSPLFQAKLTKILPHINDTLLLGSAIALVVSYQWNPLHHPWLLAKITALLIYIGLGLIAFRFAQARSSQLISWLAALCTLCYIFGVAITKSPTLHLM